MKRIMFVLLLTTAFGAFTSFSSAYAMCGMCGKEEAANAEAGTASEAKVVNKECPVAGGEVIENTPYKTVYKGQTIGFCCPECIGKFKANPEKYMAKLQKSEVQSETAGATSSESHPGHSH